MKGKKQLWVKLGLAAIVSLLVLTVITYIGISLYFEDHYYYNTIIGGEDFSYKTPIEAEGILYTKMDSYSLEISGREDVSDKILPEEINMKFLLDDTLIRIKKEQKPELWFLCFFKEYNYTFPWAVKYDEDALENKIKELAFFQAKNIRKAKDAYLTYSEERSEEHTSELQSP